MGIPGLLCEKNVAERELQIRAISPDLGMNF